MKWLNFVIQTSSFELSPILVLKKCKKPDDVLFINASEDYVKGKRQNTLSEENKRRIIATYQPHRSPPLLPPREPG